MFTGLIYSLSNIHFNRLYIKERRRKEQGKRKNNNQQFLHLRHMRVPELISLFGKYSTMSEPTAGDPIQFTHLTQEGIPFHSSAQVYFGTVIILFEKIPSLLLQPKDARVEWSGVEWSGEGTTKWILFELNILRQND